MTPALRYLLGHSFANGVRARLKRLAQPKYLLFAVIGGAYFYFYFYKFLFGGGMGGVAKINATGLSPWAWSVIGATLLLMATLLFSWIIPGSRAAITFTEAEIAFLFPAPISRRLLVVYKLLKSQLGLLFIAVLVTLCTGRFRAGHEAWYRMSGWWIILNTLNMHRIGASFALQRLRERGMADGKRRIAVVLVLGAVVGAVVLTWQALPSLPQLLTPQGKSTLDWNGIVAQIANTKPLGYLLVPFQWVVGPYFAHDLDSFLLTLGPATGMMLLHFVWVIRADVSFEEASIAASQKRAAAIAAIQEGKPRMKSIKARTPIWRLRSTGFAPLAFLWKSLIKFGGRRALGWWTTLFLVLVAGTLAIQGFHSGTGRPPGWAITTAVVVGIGCYLTILISFVMVGQAATAQLRQGMTSMDLLKTYPIPGWQLALGELAGPLLLGSLLQWAAIAIGALLASSLFGGFSTIIAIWAAALAVLLPAFNLSMSILPSAAALLFPGWFKPQDSANHGLEGTGMRLIVGIAQFAALAVALVPVAFFGACGWFVVGEWVQSFAWQSIAAGGLAAFVLALESALGVAWLGSLYDSYDTSKA